MRSPNAFDAGLIALGAALNVSIGSLVFLLKLPFFLDSIGTIFIAALCGWRYGIIVGLSSVLIMTITMAPPAIMYSTTAVVIAVLAAVLTRFGFLRSLRMTILGGILIGFVALASSAPVTAFIFHGATSSGADVITAVFKAVGFSKFVSVLLGKLLIEPVDKTVTALICYFFVQALPPRVLERISKNPQPPVLQ